MNSLAFSHSQQFVRPSYKIFGGMIFFLILRPNPEPKSVTVMTQDVFFYKIII